MSLFKTRICFKARVVVNAPEPAEPGVAYHLENLARHRRKSAVAMQITKLLVPDALDTCNSNGTVWTSLFATLERQ
jgi:hypothetical protein